MFNRPTFRSYKPQDEQLQENTLPNTKPSDLESEVKEQLESAKTAKTLIEDLDITNLAPRKPDWDLKRDIAKKLDKYVLFVQYTTLLSKSNFLTDC